MYVYVYYMYVDVYYMYVDVYYMYVIRIRVLYAVVKVSRILPDLRSGAQKFGYREILGPVTLSNAKNISGGSFRGPEIYRDPPPQISYFKVHVQSFSLFLK